MRRQALVLALLLPTAAFALAAGAGKIFFLGAPPAAAVPFEPVALPEPRPDLQPGDLALLQALSTRSPFAPRLQQLLEGQIVLTGERQMREVWQRLFDAPYPAAQLDFHQSFVVLMGGGLIADGWFEISAVEEVQATYATPGSPDGETAPETFLSVTATTFISGVPPEDPPPPSWRLSAVKIPRALLDDVVFRRNLILGQ